MKSTVSKKPCVTPAIVYPCLMTNPNTGTIMLMRSFHNGVVVVQGHGACSPVGDYCDFISGFSNATPFTGSVCLEND